jgi:hypothetical protein
VHRTVESINFHGAVLGRIATLVRGDQCFSLPATELDELAEIVEILRGDLDDVGMTIVEEELDVVRVEVDDSDVDEVVEAASDVAEAVVPVKSARRGRMWKGVRAHLESRDRAVGYKSLLALVKRSNLTDGDPNHALKILLGRKVNTGDLEVSKTGRYRLASIKDRKRGNVWVSIQEELSSHPEGMSLDGLVTAATEGEWSKAKSVRSAVTRALKRYSDTLEYDGAVYVLR